MSQYNLYNVEVSFNTVIRAKSKEEAEKLAASIVKNEDDAPNLVLATQIKTLDGLPKGWDKWCLPWGERHPMDWEICRQLEEK